MANTNFFGAISMNQKLALAGVNVRIHEKEGKAP